jgi:hypothetical protein
MLGVPHPGALPGYQTRPGGRKEKGQRPYRGTSYLCCSSTSSRISKIEIIGKNRMNKNINEANSPIVPMYVDQSQNVGRYMPHEDGK